MQSDRRNTGPWCPPAVFEHLPEGAMHADSPGEDMRDASSRSAEETLEDGSAQFTGIE